MQRRKTENRKLFNVGIKLSACFCHITLIHSSPTNPHHSTIFPPNATNRKKIHNMRWSLPLKTKLLNAHTIQGEHKEEHLLQGSFLRGPLSLVEEMSKHQNAMPLSMSVTVHCIHIASLTLASTYDVST